MGNRVCTSALAVFVGLLLTSPAVAQVALEPLQVAVIDPLSREAVVVAPLLEPGQHDTATHVAIGFVSAAHFADLATTMYLLGKCGGSEGCATKSGGHLQAVEANRVLAPSSHRPIQFALTKFGFAAASVITVYMLHEKHPKLARWVAYGVGAATFTVAIRNRQLLGTTR